MNIKKDDFITHYRLWQCLLLLSLLIFSAGMLLLIVNKVPWVDEVYSWYGIRHENHELFWKSMNSGVNYSPPLYFYINWILQLFLPLSLNILRVESLLCVVGGTILIFLTVKKSSIAKVLFLGQLLFFFNLVFFLNNQSKHEIMVYSSFVVQQYYSVVNHFPAIERAKMFGLLL